MKKKKVWIIIGVIVVAAVLTYITLTSNGKKTTNVNAATVGKQHLVEKVSASGRIQPQTKVNITSEFSGKIIALPVVEGQQVTAGQLLIVMDTVQIKADVSQARFGLDGYRAALEGAKASCDQTDEEFQRRQKLYDQKLGSETELSTAHYSYLNAKANYESLKAQVSAAEAAFDKQLDRLDKARITAPMNGVVTSLNVEVGEIAAGQTAFTQGQTLMTISDMSVFEVEVEVDETEVNKISLGQKSEIQVDAFPDTTFAGSVVEIGNTAILIGGGTQDQSTNFKVKVTFVDVNPNLRPGMSATVDITAAERKDVMAVPFASVVTRNYDLDSLERARSGKSARDSGSGEVLAAENDSANAPKDSVEAGKDKEREELKGVFVIRQGVARFAPIQTGIAGQKDIEITKGLAEKDSVVSGPYSVLRTLKDGDAVIVVKADSTKQEAK